MSSIVNIIGMYLWMLMYLIISITVISKIRRGKQLTKSEFGWFMLGLAMGAFPFLVVILSDILK